MSQFAIFDIETRIDKQLLADTLYPGADPEGAYEHHTAELREKHGSDFVALPFHVPISIAVGAVGNDMSLERIETIEGEGEDYGNDYGIIRAFWERAEGFLSRGGCLVSFNGRSFDLPVLELRALRYAVPARRYHQTKFGARYRYQTDAHFDLYDYLTNNGAARMRGGLDVLCRVCGIEAKSLVTGASVQSLYEAGMIEDIHSYCRRDVLTTWRLFLRVQVLRGVLPPERVAELEREGPEVS